MPTLAEIAALLEVALPGAAEGQRAIRGVASLAEAGPDDLSYLASDAHLGQFRGTAAGAVIVQKRVKLPPNPRPVVLWVEDADLALARVLRLFAPPVPRPPPGIDPSASVAPAAVLGDKVAIGHHVVVGQRSRIGAGTVLHAGVVIGEDVVIGQDCEIFPNVVIRERVTIGNRVIIHAGTIIGTDGFGYRWDGSQHVKIPQIGTIVIEDDVELGSCVCVDRAKTGVTRIGRGTKIDNLVQIAHNCVIGPHCIIVGQVGLAGSVTLGEGVVLGGQTAVRDHITIGDGAAAAARSAIHEDVEPKMVVSGMPALPHRQSLREQAALRRLPDLVAQVRKLQEELEKLKRNTEGK
ncbi:UDP-3-O-(3-hydroxymyristoyl)glucosamine N-acyltransferase [Fontivita pretiosa]|uniref:UDP-3-O-(3-hydroxymyristoyl)glucosamine N-acyltransferase n=1 Tax=Fontivita pretiosa TaxID=2989684 RepID=UPI003D172657